jgi:hypothetical protein
MDRLEKATLFFLIGAILWNQHDYWYAAVANYMVIGNAICAFFEWKTALEIRNTEKLRQEIAELKQKKEGIVNGRWRT